ncbi:MAG: hypothetical protein IH624_14770 [Phycisphaerae bacterium]|nr:hypothetical protein [Phycisphaerae bacterium]
MHRITFIVGGGICGGRKQLTRKLRSYDIIVQNHAWDGGGLAYCDGLIEKNLIACNTTRWWQGSVR